MNNNENSTCSESRKVIILRMCPAASCGGVARAGEVHKYKTSSSSSSSRVRARKESDGAVEENPFTTYDVMYTHTHTHTSACAIKTRQRYWRPRRPHFRTGRTPLVCLERSHTLARSLSPTHETSHTLTILHTRMHMHACI